MVYDGRQADRPMRYRFDGLSAWVIEACNEQARTADQIVTGWNAAYPGEPIGAAAVAAACADLIEKRILYEERGKYFTLAIPENPYY